MQSCRFCSKLSIDTELIKSGLVMDKCNEFNFHIGTPLLNGWRCPRYQPLYEKKPFSIIDFIKEKFRRGK